MAEMGADERGPKKDVVGVVKLMLGGVYTALTGSSRSNPKALTNPGSPQQHEPKKSSPDRLGTNRLLLLQKQQFNS